MAILNTDQAETLRRTLASPSRFSAAWIQSRPMRRYQRTPADAFAGLIAAHDGGFNVWYFSRQSGKDETLAQTIAWLLIRNRHGGGTVIVVSPTDDQSAITMNRAISTLADVKWLATGLRVNNGDTIVLGKASARFLSIKGNIRGNTASLALIANEAQDIDPDDWDSKCAPFTASTNAPSLFMGTAWEAESLLGRQRRYADRLESGDGIRRVYRITWDLVAEEVPAYAKHATDRLAQLGPNHPFWKTEYELIELGSDDRLFTEARLANLEGSHQRNRGPVHGETYAALIDIAGSDEASSGPQLHGTSVEGKRDSTVATIVRVLTTGNTVHFQTVDRVIWTNQPLSHQTDLIANLSARWHLRNLVIDATGIGASVYSNVVKALSGSTTKVHPFTFTSKSKSDLGWAVIALIDTGRWVDYSRDGERDTELLYSQARAVEHSINKGPGRLLSWGVPAHKGHDDVIISGSMVAFLDTLDWSDRRARLGTDYR